MENQYSPLLDWAHFFPGKNIEELRNSLVFTTLELEQTWLTVQQELKKKDQQLIHLKHLLNQSIKERDDANQKLQNLLLDKILLQKPNPISSIELEEDEPGRGTMSNNGFSSSDCEESIVSSPSNEPALTILPEKGKLLEAVMKAGPLLQTLLLAGPLPQWRHPPPPLKSIEIPPLTVSSLQPPQLGQECLVTVNRKRVLCEGSSDSPTTENKYQRLVL